jgi:hypothetical protein
MILTRLKKVIIILLSIFMKVLDASPHIKIERQNQYLSEILMNNKLVKLSHYENM